MSSILWFSRALLPEGWASNVLVEVTAGRIERVQSGASPGGAERHGVGLPGLANVHSHSFQRGMAGLAELRGPSDDDFWTWREWMYRFLDRLTPEDIEAIAAQAFVEMLESGFTRVGEFHYLHHAPDGSPYDNLGETAERICGAADTAGIGLTLLPVYYAQGGFGGAPPQPGQRRFLNDLGRFDKLLDASRSAVSHLPYGAFGIAPHSLRAVSPADLQHLVTDVAREPIHIHVAEQQKEVTDCLSWSGRRPVEWLLDNHDVDERWCLIHATHVTPDEMARVAGSGAVVGLCPLTEANLGDGMFPARDFLGANGDIAVGTDSNVQIDAAAELRMLEYAQRLSRRSRNVLASTSHPSTGEALHAAALHGGNQAVFGGPCGLTPEAPADIISLNMRSPAFSAGEDSVLDHWIFAGRGREVDCVWRAGAKVVSGGAHRERARTEAAFRQAVTRITR